MFVNSGTEQTQDSSFEKLLGVKIDCKLNFKGHIWSICKKTNVKLDVLTRVLGFMSPDKKDALFLSQFPYCPLTWIFHDRELNYKIDKLHERCLRLVHHGTTYSFKELLQKTVLSQNTTGLGNRNVWGLQGDISKYYDGGLPIELPFELWPKTPKRAFLNKSS